MRREGLYILLILSIVVILSASLCIWAFSQADEVQEYILATILAVEHAYFAYQYAVAIIHIFKNRNK
jgi:Na+/H+ antiporter NhaC